MGRSRAIIGVIALYALLLQAFLATLAPAAPIPAAGAVICAEHGGSEAPDDRACPHHACCIAVQAAKLILPSPTAFAAVPWAAWGEAKPVWRVAAIQQARGPPDRTLGPRGPPAL